MPGMLCCFGAPSANKEQKSPASVCKDAVHAQEPAVSVPVAVSTKPEVTKEAALVCSATQSSLPRVPSPTVSPSKPVLNVLAGGRTADELTQGLLQGLDLQRRITHLQGHWWTRVEDALGLLAKSYSAACASVWILDEATDSFIALVSKGPMRQAVQPGYSLHLGSEYDTNSPTSLTSLWDTKAAQTYSVALSANSSNPSSLHGRAFPADWKLLYNAHHFTDFLAVPIFAAPSAAGGAGGGGTASGNKSAQSNPSDSITSATVIVGTLGGAATSSTGGGAAAAAAAANMSESGSGPMVVGALTLYLSRPGADRVPEPAPSIFINGMEQELVSLAFAGLLYCNGPEPVRQMCELVLAVQSATGTGEVAAAVAAGLVARLRHVLAVSPAALMALVPPRQVSAVVFRDLTAAAPDGGGGAPDSMAVGHSSSQTLPLLHPALASVAGGGGGGTSYSGSQLHGGGGGNIRVQYRVTGIHLGDGVGVGGVGASAIERSPSLLGTGLRGEASAGGPSTTGPDASLGAAGVGAGFGGGGGVPARQYMHNSRSMGGLHGQNPSGLFSCRLDRLPSRYKALVYPLSHTLLQVVLQLRQERKAREQHLRAGNGAAAPPHVRQSTALRDLCMSAAAASASGSAAYGGGWIVGDCNEHLHAVHSPSRDVYVMTRVNGRRPHSLVVATAELSGLGGNAEAGGGGGGVAGGHAGGGGASATHIAVYLAFSERLPRALLETALTDTQLLMRRLIAPLIRHRFENSLSEEWTALAAAANNLPSPGGPVLRIASSVSASQARHSLPVPAPLLLSGQGLGALTSDISPANAAAAAMSTTPPIAEAHSSTWLSRLGGAGPHHGASTAAGAVITGPAAPYGTSLLGGTSVGTIPVVGGAGCGTAGMSTSELHLEGLSAGEALQQISVLVSSYMDTLQALQGQLMASDRVAESLRREDLPHLQLLEVLGHGGGGVVFRGKLHALEVAVKVFEVPGDLATAAGLSPPQHQQGGAGGGAGVRAGGSGSGSGDEKSTAWPAVGDRRVLQRSALELAVTASISHPHIIQVYSLYTNMVLVKQKPPKHGTSGVQLLELSQATALSRADEGIPCSALCMEYCDMGTLAHAIDQHRFMAVNPLGARRPALKAICTTLLEVALALRHLHARNLAHCDLKPANVLLKSSRRDSRGFTCKLADFGYVSVLKPSVPGGRPTILPEEACGTVTHMAPETFIKGQPLDFSVDTFSFGVLMWELYTCARPYTDVPEDQIAQRVTLKGLRPTFPSDAPRAYGALARQCWSQDPNERPTASEIVSAIENMLQIMNTQLPAIPPLKPKAAAIPSPGGAGSGGAGSSPADKGVPPPQPGVHLPADKASPRPQQTQQQQQQPGQPQPPLQHSPHSLQRMRGSLNGGALQYGASPCNQSPLGRPPVAAASVRSPSPSLPKAPSLPPSPLPAATVAAAAAAPPPPANTVDEEEEEPAPPPSADPPAAEAEDVAT